MLDAEDGYTFGKSVTGEFITASDRLGQHGYLPTRPDYKASLIAYGAGITRRGSLGDVRMIDIAPTIAHLSGFPLIDGRDLTGRTSSERGIAPDVYLKRQDGHVLDDIIDASDSSRPERTYIFLLDGHRVTDSGREGGQVNPPLRPERSPVPDRHARVGPAQSLRLQRPPGCPGQLGLGHHQSPAIAPAFNVGFCCTDHPNENVFHS